MLGQRCAVDDFRWGDRDAIAVDVGVKPVGGGAARRPEKMIKPTVKRSVGNRPRVIDLLYRLEPVF